RRGRSRKTSLFAGINYLAYPQTVALLGGDRRRREVDVDLGFLAGPDGHLLGARLGLAVADHLGLQRVEVLRAAIQGGGDEHAAIRGRSRRIAIHRQFGLGRQGDDDRRRSRLDAGLLLLRLDRDHGPGRGHHRSSGSPVASAAVAGAATGTAAAGPAADVAAAADTAADVAAVAATAAAAVAAVATTVAAAVAPTVVAAVMAA